MKSTEFRLSLPVPEKISTNRIYSGLHWSERNRLKDLYHAHLLPWRLSRPELKFPVKITYTFVWSKRPLDSTNQTFMIKMLEDGLVKIGILPDDTPKYVKSTTSTSVEDRTCRGDSVEITIEPSS